MSGRRSAARRNRLRDEDGSTLLLTIAYGTLSLLLVLVVVAASSLYLERKRLFTLADGAALAGSESFELAPVGAGETDAGRALKTADVASAVDVYLALPHGQFEGLEVTRAFSADGSSATVSLTAQWHPPLLTLLIPAGLPIDVTAVARSVLW